MASRAILAFALASLLVACDTEVREVPPSREGIVTAVVSPNRYVVSGIRVVQLKDVSGRTRAACTTTRTLASIRRLVVGERVTLDDLGDLSDPVPVKPLFLLGPRWAGEAGQSLALTLVDAGLARSAKRARVLRARERAAKRNRLGMWRPC